MLPEKAVYVQIVHRQRKMERENGRKRYNEKEKEGEDVIKQVTDIKITRT